MTLRFTVPEMIMGSEYEMSGTILVIPIQGTGALECNLTAVEGSLDAKGHVVKRDNDEWVEVDDVKLSLELLGKATMHFTNLFNGDKRLGDSTNKFLNDNYKEAYDAYRHMPEGGLSKVFLDFTTRVFNAYPVSQLFLD